MKYSFVFVVFCSKFFFFVTFVVVVVRFSSSSDDDGPGSTVLVRYVMVCDINITPSFSPILVPKGKAVAYCSAQ